MRPYIYMLACWGVMCVACGNKPQTTDSKELLYSMEAPAPDGVQRMKPLHTEQQVTWNGKTYHCVLDRKADESLPKVQDDFGDQYIDNSITLSIGHEGNGHFFQKTFTKQTFASVVDERFLAHALLEGIAFDKATEQGLVFAASISYPQSDLFVPVSITIARDGSMTLRKGGMQEEEDYPEGA